MVLAAETRTAVVNKKRRLAFPDQPPGPNNPYIDEPVGGVVAPEPAPGQGGEIGVPKPLQPKMPGPVEDNIVTGFDVPEPVETPGREPVLSYPSRPPGPDNPYIDPITQQPVEGYEPPVDTGPVILSEKDELYTKDYITKAKEKYLEGLASPEEKERARALRSKLAGMGILSGSAFDVEQGEVAAGYMRGAEQLGRDLEMENIQYQSPEAIKDRALEQLAIFLPLARQPGASQELKDKVNRLLELIGEPGLTAGEDEVELTFPDQPEGPNNPPVEQPVEEPIDYLPDDLTGPLAVVEQKYEEAYQRLLDVANLHDESKDVIGGQRNPYYNEELRDELRAKAARIKELAPNINAYMQTGSGATPEEIKEYIDLVNEAYAMEYTHIGEPAPPPKPVTGFPTVGPTVGPSPFGPT